jgi:endonuclease I
MCAGTQHAMLTARNQKATTKFIPILAKVWQLMAADNIKTQQKRGIARRQMCKYMRINNRLQG